jgi:hypothetical protein
LQARAARGAPPSSEAPRTRRPRPHPGLPRPLGAALLSPGPSTARRRPPPLTRRHPPQAPPLGDALGLLEPFPCLADELEQQARALDFLEWPAAAAGRSPAAPAALAAASPPLLATALGPQPLGYSAREACRRAPAPAAAPRPRFTLAPATRSPLAAAPPAPARPQQELAEAAALEPPALEPPKEPAPPAAASLGAALANADAVRRGRASPWAAAGAWRGCGASARCALERAHDGACDACAVAAPGLASFSAEELAAAGLRSATLGKADLPPAAAAAAVAALAAAAPTLTSPQPAERLARAPPAAAAAAAAGSDASAASAAGGKAAEQEAHTPRRGAPPARRAATKRAAASPAAPPAADAGASDGELRSTLTAEARLAAAAAPRRAQGKRARPAARAAAAAPAAKRPRDAAPAKRAAARAPSAGDAAARRGRWRTPADGAYGPPPASGGPCCSQCGATVTPVWRNGPFGPKSLCNACGVRFKR